MFWGFYAKNAEVLLNLNIKFFLSYLRCLTAGKCCLGFVTTGTVAPSAGRALLYLAALYRLEV